MNWSHLIEAARLLAGASGASAQSGRPRQIMLRRAVSTAYYALFHALCSSNAHTLIGTLSTANRLAWMRTYRALDHGPAKNRMEQRLASLPVGIQTFAKEFSILQEQRHRADYDPAVGFRRSEVIRLIDRAEIATQSFYAADIAERRYFATLVLFRNR